MWVSTMQSTEGLNGTKRQTRENTLCLTVELDSNLCPQHSGFSDSNCSLRHWLSCSWAFELYHWSSWASPACWWQTVGLLSLQCPMSQYQLSIYPSIYIYTCIVSLSLYLYSSSISSVSLENSDLNISHSGSTGAFHQQVSLQCTQSDS